MKKLLSLAVASFAMAAVAVDYSPTIGVTQITTTNKNTIVAVPFNSLADGGNMSVTNLVCTNGLSSGTHIYVFKGGNYKAWTLDAANGWAALDTVSGNSDLAVPSAGDDLVASPGAIWVVLPEAPADSKTFCIYGQWADITATDITAGANNLVANPLQSKATVGFTGSPVRGDTIVIPQDGTPESYTYGKKGWTSDGASATLPNIEVGQGFWYVCNSTSTVTKVTWTPVTP